MSISTDFQYLHMISLPCGCSLSRVPSSDAPFISPILGAPKNDLTDNADEDAAADDRDGIEATYI